MSNSRRDVLWQCMTSVQTARLCSEFASRASAATARRSGTQRKCAPTHRQSAAVRSSSVEMNPATKLRN